MYISLVFQTKHFLPSSSVFPHNCCLTRILSISRTFCGRMLKGQKKVFCDVVSICALNMVNKTMASLLKQPQQPRFIQKKLSYEMCAIAAVKASAKKCHTTERGTVSSDLGQYFVNDLEKATSGEDAITMNTLPCDSADEGTIAYNNNDGGVEDNFVNYSWMKERPRRSPSKSKLLPLF